jgi:UDP-N-acetylglucosamine 3-dehydrogenase
MTTYACAVIAAGSQGRVHAQGYLATAGARLVAAADPDDDAAGELARDLATPGVYDSYAELLAAEHPDVVSICTPPDFHLEGASTRPSSRAPRRP